MYVCGVTVYDLCHLGHARTFVAFDMIVRYLRFRGYDVTFVRNITDIDDKIIQRARDTGEDWRSLTERMVHEMHIDFAKLGILPPDIEPRPTEHIPQIISMIERLLHRQFAYIAENGDVMFSTASAKAVSYTHLRAHETVLDLVCRLLLEKNTFNSSGHQIQ